MRIKSQDIKPGMILRTRFGFNVKVEQVNIMDEKKSLFAPAGKDPLRIPPCVFVVLEYKGVQAPYAFEIDEEVERAFAAE